MINEKNKLYLKRMELYMEAMFYSVNIKEEFKRYTTYYKIEELHKKVLANKDSELNKYILRVEEIIEEMEPDKYINDETMEPLLNTKLIYDNLLRLRSLLVDYLLSKDDITLF